MERAVILDEHAPRPELNKPEVEGSYEPSDEERKAIKTVEDFFKKSKKWRSQHDKDWIENYKFFRGQQWREQRPSYRHSECINMVFQTIQSFVPILTDSRPKFEFVPQEPSDQEFSSILNDACECDWTTNNWLQVVTEALYDSHIFGVAFGSLEHKNNKEITNGDLLFQTEDPLYCYPDPNCRNINDDRCRGFLIAEPVDIELLKEYPNGKFVQPDLSDLSKSDKTDLDGYSKLKLPIDDTKVMRESFGSIESINANKALKKTLYIYDESYDENEKTDENGVLYYEQVKKYPKGRKIVVAGKVLLEDGPIGYEDGKIPVAKLVNYMLPREFFGISEIEQVKGPQKIFNKLVSFSLDVLTLMGNPIWVVSSDSGVDVENLFNKPGLIVEKNPGSEVRREEGVQLQPYVFQIIDRVREWFNEITGSSDVSRGAQPTGVTAAQAIADLQEAAQTRLRLKSRHLDAFLQDIGQMWLSRTLQFRDAPKMYRLTGADGANKYFKMHIQTMMDEMGAPMVDEYGAMKKVAMIQEYAPDGSAIPNVKQIEIKGWMDVRVQTGSSLPFMKSKTLQNAKDLFQAGVIDNEELLKTMDWPNWQAVLNRVQEKQMQQAQAEMAAQAPAPPIAQ